MFKILVKKKRRALDALRILPLARSGLPFVAQAINVA